MLIRNGTLVLTLNTSSFSISNILSAQGCAFMSQAREAEGQAAEGRPAAAEEDPDIIDQETLRKYIAYAKQNCHPKLQNADYDKIAQVTDCLLLPSLLQ